MDTDSRKKLGKANREWGYEAESLAAEYFISEGYVVRERNWRVGHLEIDLILEKDRTIVFVEVKARATSEDDAIFSINFRKRRRIINAADVYLRQQRMLYQYRFDIVTIIGNSSDYKMHHYPDAFLPPVNGGRR